MNPLSCLQDTARGLDVCWKRSFAVGGHEHRGPSPGVSAEGKQEQQESWPAPFPPNFEATMRNKVQSVAVPASMKNFTNYNQPKEESISMGKNTPVVFQSPASESAADAPLFQPCRWP